MRDDVSSPNGPTEAPGSGGQQPDADPPVSSGGEKDSPRVVRARAAAEAMPAGARLVDLLAISMAAGISVRTVQSWVAEGRLRVTRLGRCVRVRVSDWIAFLEQHGAS